MYNFYSILNCSLWYNKYYVILIIYLEIPNPVLRIEISLMELIWKFWIARPTIEPQTSCRSVCQLIYEYFNPNIEKEKKTTRKFHCHFYPHLEDAKVRKIPQLCRIFQRSSLKVFKTARY